MKELPTQLKEVIKWLALRLEKLATKALAAAKPLSSNQSVLISIIAYWGLTPWVYHAWFGLNAKLFHIELDNLSGFIYYTLCCLPCYVSYKILNYSRILNDGVATLIQKSTVVMLLFLILENLGMAIDAYYFPYKQTWLDRLDLFIQGDPSWLFPIGASDMILAGICSLCLIGLLREYRLV